MHPHEYGDIGDFIYSPMGYFTDDYKFGQTDKDAIQRAHVDQVYIEAQTLLAEVSGNPEVAGLVSQVRDKLTQVDSEYSRMEYEKALQPALAAYDLARETSPTLVPPGEILGHLEDSLNKTRKELAETKSEILLYYLAGLGVGLIVAVVVFFLIYRKAPRLCNSCGGKILPKSMFCKHCGSRQPES
jgi:hypothetical protein